MWHFTNWHIATWFFLHGWQYQNKFHTYNQHAGNYPASCNPPLMERPNSTSNRVDSLVYSDRNLLGTPSLCGNSHQSYRIRHNRHPLVLLKVNVPWWSFVTSSICQIYSLGQVVNHSLNDLSKEAKFLRFLIFCCTPINWLSLRQRMELSYHHGHGTTANSFGRYHPNQIHA